MFFIKTIDPLKTFLNISQPVLKTIFSFNNEFTGKNKSITLKVQEMVEGYFIMAAKFLQFLKADRLFSADTAICAVIADI